MHFKYFGKSVWSVLWCAQEKFKNFFSSFVVSVCVCAFIIYGNDSVIAH